ncbi:MAG TPA: hypothetical protein VH419_12000 [Nocardioidaceae bacterium]
MATDTCVTVAGAVLPVREGVPTVRSRRVRRRADAADLRVADPDERVGAALVGRG